MSDLNCYTAKGRLVRDPETRTTQTEKTVVGFSIAVNGYTDDDTLFIDCSAWEKTGDFVAKYFKKGSEIIIQGRLKTDKWQDAQGGNREKTAVVVSQAHFCGAKAQTDDKPDF